jgi:halocyanin-like protein
MSERSPQNTCTRRTLLRAGAGATALAATGASGTALAQENQTSGNQTSNVGSVGGGGNFDFGGYLDDAGLYDGTVEDLRGESAVTVAVGADNGYAFDPPAIRVDPGTTVTWEWTGQGGAHNVIAESGTFDSGEPQTSGTFEHTFEEEATFTYYCNPHKGAGMKGGVVVGSGGDPGGGDGGEPTAANETALQTLLAMVVLGLLSPILFLLIARRRMSGPPRAQ